jgi:hypothetical protein
MQSPLFTPMPFDAFEFTIKMGMGEPTPNPNQIVERFKGSDGIASQRILAHYNQIMQTAISNPGKTQEGDLLQEHSLGVSGTISFLYIHTTLKVYLNRLSPMQFFGEMVGHRYGMQFGFNTALWPLAAELVLQQELTTLDDWLAGL